MYTKLSLTIIMVMLSVALGGCGSKASSPSNASENNNQNVSNSTESSSEDNYQMLPLISGNVADVSLDAMADGTAQQLKKGEVMSIALDSNRSTGYSWFATISNPAVLVQMGEPQYQIPTSDPDTPIVGAAGTETFYFQAADVGTTTLTLDYKRGFEANTAPEKTVTIRVEVK